MSTIKQRRLALPVACHAHDHVGDYVPFYLCPRSIMLFVIHCANHPDLTYRCGQVPIHKLMYFVQEAGEPLRLRYTKALYGPYAENLRQVLAHVEGHF